MKRIFTIFTLITVLMSCMGVSAEEGHFLEIDGDTAYVTVYEDFVGDVIIASYAENGTLLDVKAFPDRVVTNTETYEFDITDLDRENSGSIKLFLWKPSMQPYEYIDTVNGEYNTFSVSGTQFVAEIYPEDDINEDCTALLCDVDGDTVSEAYMTYDSEAGKWSVYGNVPDESTKYTIRILDANGSIVRRYNLYDEKAPTNELIYDFASDIENKVATLDELLAKCAEKGITTDYETVYRNVISRYVEQMQSMVSGKNQRYALMVYEKCIELYNKTKENLVAYLNGEKVPFDVPKYVTSDIEVDGVTFIADTVYKGETVRRPVHFVGFNYLREANGQMDIFESVGVNHVQRELGPSDSMKKDSRVWKYGVTGTATAEETTERNQSDEKSLKITNTDGSGGAKITQSVSLNANTTYYFGISTYGSGISSAKILLGNVEKQLPSFTRYKWVNNAYSFTPTTKGTFTFTIETEGTIGSLYLDDAYVKAGSINGENLLGNPGFENNKGYTFNYDKINAYCAEFKEAEENGIAVDLLISSHYVPDFFYERNPNLTGNVFMSEAYRELISEYLSVIIPAFTQYKSIKTICLMNEPTFRAADYGEIYLGDFMRFLQEKYGDDISKLNSAYGTSYTSFGSVPMPEHENYNYTPAYRDYWEFNNTFMTDYHAFLQAEVRKYCDIPTHTKMMWNMGSIDYDHDRSRWNDGINHEKMAEITEYNGNDNTYYLRNMQNDWYREEMSKSITYDYQLGVKYAPVVNSEDHIIPDDDFNPSDEQKKVNVTDIWQNAFHGRSQSAIWGWANTYTNEKNMFFGKLLGRPDAFAEVMAAAFDLNRLSWEIKAVNDMPYEIAVLYSDTTRNYTDTHMHRVYDAYESLYYSGYKVKIVPESRIGELDENIKMLVLPNTTHLSEATVNAIYDHIQNGVETVILHGAPTYDENGKEHTTSKVTEIKNASSSFSYETVRWPNIVDRDLVRADLSEIADRVCDNVLRIYDTTTGKPIDKTEYQLGYYGDKVIVSVARLDHSFGDDVAAEIYLNGKKLTGMTELRSGEYVGSIVGIKPFEPILLQADMN